MRVRLCTIRGGEKREVWGRHPMCPYSVSAMVLEYDFLSFLAWEKMKMELHWPGVALCCAALFSRHHEREKAMPVYRYIR